MSWARGDHDRDDRADRRDRGAVLVCDTAQAVVRGPVDRPRSPPSRRSVVTLSETGADSLAHLSLEPILIRQAQDGLRVQLDDRPLVPIAILTDHAAAAALREIVAAPASATGPAGPPWSCRPATARCRYSGWPDETSTAPVGDAPSLPVRGVYQVVDC